MTNIKLYKPSFVPDRSLIFDTHQQILDKFFDEFFGSRKFFNVNQTSYPKMDITEDSDFLYVSCAVPGILNEDLEIETNKDDKTFSIKGQTSSKYYSSENTNHVHMRELKHSSFSRTIRLPDYVDIEKCEAKLRDGILSLKFHIYKTEENKELPSVKKITIK